MTAGSSARGTGRIWFSSTRRREAATSPILAKCGWSPFSGFAFAARVRATWVNGELRYRDGRFLPGAGGRALEYDR